MRSITNKIYDLTSCHFVADSRAAAIAPELYPHWAASEVGFLISNFLLSDLCQDGITEAEALRELDELSEERRIRIFSAAIPYKVGGIGDVQFSALVGAAVFELTPPLTSACITQPFLFATLPFPADFDFGGAAILKPSQKVRELRENVEQAKILRFGQVDLSLEARLHYQDILDQAKLRRAILAELHVK